MQDPNPKSNGKEVLLGRTRLILYATEFALIWIIYYCFGLAAKVDMPLWLTTLMIVTVDRLVTFAGTIFRRPSE